MIVLIAYADAAPLSLADAQAEARAHAPEAAQLVAGTRGAEAVARQSGRWLREDPEFSVGVEPGDTTGWSAGVELPVDLSGSWGARRSSATASLDATRIAEGDGLLALDEAVAVAVAESADSQRALGRARRNAALWKVAADAARAQAAAGGATTLELDAADTDLALANAEVARAEGELASAQAGLARLLGRERGDGIEAGDPMEPSAAPAEPAWEQLVQASPRLLAAEAEVRAVEAEVSMWGRMAAPRPTLGVDWTRQTFDAPTGPWTEDALGLTLRVPIPLFDRKTEERSAAQARLWMAQADLDATRADIRAELQSAWAAYAAAARGWQAVAGLPAIQERDAGWLAAALRGGVLTGVDQATALRRFEEAGRQVDEVVLRLRRARAAWVRGGGT